MSRMSRKTFVIFQSSLIVLALVAAGAALAGKPGWLGSSEKLSDRIAETQVPATPYPEAEMKTSLERKNLRERLIRFNNPSKIGYLYVTTFGKFVGYYVIKGKVSSTQSQMTNTQQTFREGSHDTDGLVVDSIGDDGSFGINEGGDAGVFFFTATGVMVETTLDWIYSDAPLHINVPNLLGK